VDNNTQATIAVNDTETYARFIMTPRHFTNGVLGNQFISLRPIDKGGISGFIYSRFKANERIDTHKANTETKSKQKITAMGTAKVQDIRNCSCPGKIDVDVVLTEQTYPYHAEIRFTSVNNHTLITQNLRSAEYILVCDQIKNLLKQGEISIVTT
jgi:hypothetical protein